MASTIDEQILQSIADILEISPDLVTPDKHFINDLGATSLDIVELIMTLEERFQIEVPDELAEQVQTVRDVIGYAQQLLKPSASLTKTASPDTPTIAIASDHAGFSLKETLKVRLHERGVLVRDLGPSDAGTVDYPSFAQRVGAAIQDGSSTLGILICGTGLGMSIAANKMKHVRAAVVTTVPMAQLARRHNDANVICFGARIIGTTQAEACLDAFLDASFDPGDDGRHQRRLNLISGLD